jgi:hypothetical protein
VKPPERRRPWMRGPGTLPAVQRLSWLTGRSERDALTLLRDAAAERMARPDEMPQADGQVTR